jgi:predicted DNA-binding transcriptional regulator YafY
MDRTERFYKIDQQINEKKLVSFRDLQDALEVSRATLKRDLEYMRNRLNAPIVWDRDAGGYRFEQMSGAAGGQYELPGLWFNASEVHALLTMQHLLANLDPGGILTSHVQPLMARLNALLGAADNTAEEIRKRILIVGQGKRKMKMEHFEQVGSALLRRKRMMITYYARHNGQTTEREVSPQRLVHYRENWYLDTWCHLRNGLRNFAVDSIKRVEVLDKQAKEVARGSIDEVLGPGYGIFSGKTTNWARLRFTPERARWVSQESWHPKQAGTWESDGSYVLEVPYADDRELLMDILKFGGDVEVLEPTALKKRVISEVAKMGMRYSSR